MSEDNQRVWVDYVQIEQPHEGDCDGEACWKKIAYHRKMTISEVYSLAKGLANEHRYAVRVRYEVVPD